MTKKAIESQPQVNGGVGTQSFVYFRSENDTWKIFTVVLYRNITIRK
jgi:hypothetical protein